MTGCEWNKMFVAARNKKCSVKTMISASFMLLSAKTSSGWLGRGVKTKFCFTAAAVDHLCPKHAGSRYSTRVVFGFWKTFVEMICFLCRSCDKPWLLRRRLLLSQRCRSQWVHFSLQKQRWCLRLNHRIRCLISISRLMVIINLQRCLFVLWGLIQLLHWASVSRARRYNWLTGRVARGYPLLLPLCSLFLCLNSLSLTFSWPPFNLILFFFENSLRSLRVFISYSTLNKFKSHFCMHCAQWFHLIQL